MTSKQKPECPTEILRRERGATAAAATAAAAVAVMSAAAEALF